MGARKTENSLGGSKGRNRLSFESNLCEQRISLGVRDQSVDWHKLELPEDFLDSVPKAGYEVIPILIPHLNIYRTLPMFHRDPFDRILVAQATAEALVLISRDPEIAKYDVDVLTC